MHVLPLNNFGTSQEHHFMTKCCFQMSMFLDRDHRVIAKSKRFFSKLLLPSKDMTMYFIKITISINFPSFSDDSPISKVVHWNIVVWYDGMWHYLGRLWTARQLWTAGRLWIIFQHLCIVSVQRIWDDNKKWDVSYCEVKLSLRHDYLIVKFF